MQKKKLFASNDTGIYHTSVLIQVNLEVIRAKIVYPKMAAILFFFLLNCLPSLLSLFHLLTNLTRGHLVRWGRWEEGVVVKHGKVGSDPIAQGLDRGPQSNGSWGYGGWTGAHGLDGVAGLVLVGG